MEVNINEKQCSVWWKYLTGNLKCALSRKNMHTNIVNTSDLELYATENKLVGINWSLLSSSSYPYTHVSHLLARKFKVKLMC